MQVGDRMSIVDPFLSIGYAAADTCRRKGVGCRDVVRLNTLSIKRCGLTYSIFNEDFRGRGKVKLFFECQRVFIESSTRANRPVVTITLRIISRAQGYLYHFDSLGDISRTAENALITDPHRARTYPSTLRLFLIGFCGSQRCWNDVGDGSRCFRVD